jgi:hypothetical protein
MTCTIFWRRSCVPYCRWFAAHCAVAVSLLVFGPKAARADSTNTLSAAGVSTNTVPAGVNRLTAKLWGAGGGSSAAGFPGNGGGGAFALTTLAVTPGQQIVVVVGQHGTNSGAALGGAGSGDANGGQPGYLGDYNNRGQGGQASSVFYLSNGVYYAQAIAGAGGGAGLGMSGSQPAGGGGGQNGSNGLNTATAGLAGMNGIGGAGGYTGASGTNYNLAAITSGITALNQASGNGGAGTNWSGGGGGGYGGGGGGGGGTGGAGAGGGGGGSYGLTVVNGNFRTPGNTNDPNYVSPAGFGAIANSTVANDGLVVLIYDSVPPPAATTLAATAITGDAAQLNASVNPSNSPATYYFQYGPTTSYGSFTPTNSLASGTSPVSVSAVATGLTPQQLYNFRVVASSIGGVSLGSNLTFTTSSGSNNAYLSALSFSGGALSPAFATNVFLYANTSAVASVTVTASAVDTNALLQTRLNGGTFAIATNGLPSVPVTLIPGTNTIDLRVSATDGVTVNTYTITAAWSDVPSAVTQSASSIGRTNATGNGLVNPNNLPTSYYFQHGSSTAYGFFSATNSVNGTSAVPVSAQLNGLNPGSAWYYRLVASNAKGSTNGSNIILTTLPNTNATLSSLSFSVGTLSPAFATGTTNYSVTTNITVGKGTVTAASTDFGATLRARVNAGGYVGIPNGAPSSSLNFARGTNTLNVQVTAQDGVTVRTYNVGFNATDVTPPVLTCPASVQSNALAGCSLAVTYSVTVTDDFVSGVTVIYSPPSGSIFNVGSNHVFVTAYDPSNNTNTCGFPLFVYPPGYATNPPTIIGATNLFAPGSTSGPVVVNFTVTATNTCQPNVPVNCVPPSGSSFSLGTNLVTCTATDAFGVTNQATFQLIVQLQPPQISSLTATNLTASGGQLSAFVQPNYADASWYFEWGTNVSFGNSSPTNLIPSSGTLTPVSYTVTGLVVGATNFYRLTARSANGTAISATNTFVTPNPYLSAFSISTAPLSPAFSPTQFLYTGTATNQAVVLSCTEADVSASASFQLNGGGWAPLPGSGPTFTTNINLTYLVTNTAGVRLISQGGSSTNIYTALVYLADVIPPVIHTPGNLTNYTAVGQCFTNISYTVTATDNVDPSPVLTVTPPSGSSFPVGISTVTCVAHDASGNYSTNTFTVTVYPGAVLDTGAIWFPSSGLNSGLAWPAFGISGNGMQGVAGGNGSLLYMTTNGGSNWSASASFTNSVWTAAAVSADGTRQYVASASGSTVYVSSNFFATFSTARAAVNPAALACSRDGSTVYSLDGDSVWSSPDFGNSWFGDLSLPNGQAVACSADGKTVVAVGTNSLVLFSRDAGTTWFGGFARTNWSCAAMSTNGVIWGVAGNNTLINVSTNGGTNWFSAASVRPWTSLKCTSDGQKWIAAASDGYVGQSVDGGRTWVTRLSNMGTTYLDYAPDGSRAVAASGAAGGLFSVPAPGPYTSPPGFANLSNLTVNAASPNGTVVNYPVQGTNICQPNLPTTFIPPSGTFFPPGVTNVTCRATDIFGMSATNNFTLTVNAPPQLSGLTVSFGTNTAVGLPNATFRASANPNGLATVAQFLYGRTVAGTPPGGATATAGLTASFSPTNYSGLADPLLDGSTYYWLAVASNAAGITLSATQTLSAPLMYLAGDLNHDGVVSSNEVNAVLDNYYSATYMTNPAVGPNGLFQFSITGPSGFGLQVQGSSDLITWSNLPNAAFPIFEFLDPDATNSLHRYYRLR